MSLQLEEETKGNYPTQIHLVVELLINLRVYDSSSFFCFIVIH